MSIEKLDRNREIYRRHKEGESYRKLSEEYGVSYERIHQIVSKVRERILQDIYYIPEIEKACKELEGDERLNTRIQNAIYNNKFDIAYRWTRLTREEILNMPYIGDRAADVIEYAQVLYKENFK